MSVKHFKTKCIAWLRVIRIQFYPMTFIAYSVGTAAAYSASGKFSRVAYLLGYAVLFFIELSTILANEYYDYPSDRINKNASPFTGGTRVLVEGRLTFSEIKAGIGVTICFLAVAACMLMAATGGVSAVSFLVVIATGVFLGLGYTVPPIKFCYRGLGEVVVSATHGPYVILCGYIFQTGTWKSPVPWLLSIPIFFATFAAITLAGIPDRHADVEVGKKTAAVILGCRAASVIAIACAGLAAVSGLLLVQSGIIGVPGGYAMIIAIPHACILLAGIIRFIRSGDYDRRINGIMQLALSYIIWFGIIPLISLL